jgi:hypothetical protein
MTQDNGAVRAKSEAELVAETRARRKYLTDELKKLEKVEKALRIQRRGRPRKAGAK